MVKATRRGIKSTGGGLKFFESEAKTKAGSPLKNLDILISYTEADFNTKQVLSFDALSSYTNESKILHM